MTNEEISKLYSFLDNLGVTTFLLNGKDLPGHIARGLWMFTLEVEDHFDDETKLEAKLYFYRLGAGSYCLLKYHAHLRYISDQSKNEKQDFYLHEMVTTLRKAFNLLQGRSVEMQVFGRSGVAQCIAWVKLNFSDIDKHGNYGFTRYRSGPYFDLAKALDFYTNILEATTARGRAAIIRSLKQGNKELVTFMNANGHGVKQFIEANPKMKTLKIYDQTRKSKIKIHRPERKSKNNDIGKGLPGEGSAVNVALMGAKSGVRDYEFGD